MGARRRTDTGGDAMKTHYIYAAIAQYGGRDAGHVCYGRTRDEARHGARRSQMSVVIRRERATDTQIQRLVAVGKL